MVFSGEHSTVPDELLETAPFSYHDHHPGVHITTSVLHDSEGLNTPDLAATESQVPFMYWPML